MVVVGGRDLVDDGNFPPRTDGRAGRAEIHDQKGGVQRLSCFRAQISQQKVC